MHCKDIFSANNDNYMFLIADTDNFTFIYFKKKFISCSLCTPEGEKRWGEGETSPSSSLC